MKNQEHISFDILIDVRPCNHKGIGHGVWTKFLSNGNFVDKGLVVNGYKTGYWIRGKNLTFDLHRQYGINKQVYVITHKKYWI